MGSQQSTSISPPSKHDKSETNTLFKSEDTTDIDTKTMKKKKIPPNLKGFQLIEYKCRKKRRAYDICSNTKHTSFVAGQKVEDEDGDELSCEDLFDIYKECIFKGMLKDRNKRGIKSATAESALGDYAEDLEEE